MLSPNDIKEKLSDRNLKMVAEKTGIGYRTIRLLANGQAKLIELSSLEKISNYLEANNETTA